MNFYYTEMNLLLTLILVSTIKCVSPSSMFIHYLEPGVLYNRTDHETSYPHIFCFKGLEKALIHTWETIQLRTSLVDGFEQFDGFTPDDVLNKFDEQKSSWNLFNFYSGRKKNIKLYPFNQTCIGIVSSKEYTVKLNRIRIDYWKLIALAIGVGIFLYSPRLCKNSLFYYMTGISVGTCASFLILIYVVSRFLPRKPIMYSFLAGGWTVGLYFAQLIWDNLRTIALEYKSHVLGYAAVTSLISFAVCYRYGPVSDPRTVNLIQWTLQAVGLTLIFLSSEYQEASLSLMLLLLMVYNIPKSLISWFFRKCHTLFSRPKPRKLLTDDEYHQQGAFETRKALDDLRGYCSSPECNQWKTILRLKDPLRFAKFVQGSSHLEDNEVLSFETNHKNIFYNDLISDDSSSD